MCDKKINNNNTFCHEMKSVKHVLKKKHKIKRKKLVIKGGKLFFIKWNKFSDIKYLPQKNDDKMH